MASPCSCPLSDTPFVCPVHKVLMSKEYHTICRGEPLIFDHPEKGKTEHKYNRESYVQHWKGIADAGVTTFDEVLKLGGRDNPEDDIETNRIVDVCALLGRDIGEEKCNCTGSATKRVRVFNCAKHGACSISPSLNTGLRHCSGCNDHVKSAVKFKHSEYGKVPNRATSKVTIATAVGGGEEYSAIWASLNSVLVYHRKDLDRYNIELLVGDCQHQSKTGETTARWVRSKPRVTIENKTFVTGRYYPWLGPDGTAQPRNSLFEFATGEIVIVIDPHVFLGVGAIQAIVDHLDENPKDLVFGPLVDDNQSVSWFQRPKWSRGACGLWSNNIDTMEGPFAEWQREMQGDRSKPFEIWQQGFGMFACRRDFWPGFHPDFREWGGCETYGCEAVRALGGRAVCVPKAEWWHRFQRPQGATWQASERQKLKNYLIGFHHLGLKTEFFTAIQHFVTFRNKNGSPLLPDSEVHKVAREVYATYGPPPWSTRLSETLTPWASQLLEDTQIGAATEFEEESSVNSLGT